MDEVMASDVALEPGREQERVRSRFRPGPARRAQIAWGYVLLLPAVVFLAVLIVEPFAKAVQYSLESWDGIGPARYVGFDNY
jgi:raffinose/stachyose/melibiose transport system permease protein